MTDIDEAMLIAWVDGELDEVTRRRVERAVAEDPALADRLAMHRRLRERLSGHYAPIEAEPVPPALQAMLEDSARIVPLARAARPARGRWIMGGAIAASLVLGLGLGRLSGGPESPIALSNGVMTARGELASALDTQLASAQDGAAIRIGLSFRQRDGGWCRSFEGGAGSGVACREGRNWRVKQLLPGAGQDTAYRQASSGDPRLMATIDSLIKGVPANAAQEKTGRAEGWR